MSENRFVYKLDDFDSEVEMLEKINEQIKENKKLRKELTDCEKFRYTVFQRMGELK